MVIVGIVLGRILMKREYGEVWKLQLLSAFVLSYAVGAGVGTGLYITFGIYGLLVPATTILLLGFPYRFYYLCNCHSPAEDIGGGAGSIYSALGNDDDQGAGGGAAKLVADGEDGSGAKLN